MSVLDSVAEALHGLSGIPVALVRWALLLAAAGLLLRAGWWLANRVLGAFTPRRPGGRRAGPDARQLRHATNSGDFTVAARGFDALGDPAAASRVRELAATTLAARGELARAARHLNDLGRRRDAARMLLRAGDWRGAAVLFREEGARADEARALATGGRHVEAAAAWQACGRREEALRALVRAASTADDETAEDLLARAAALAARLGRADQAARLYERAGRQAEAARWHAEAGQPTAAAGLLEQAGDLEAAAAAHERAGDVAAVSRCRARLALAEGRREEAAALFAQAGLPGEAGGALAECGRAAEAASLLESAGAFAEAASQYRLAGDPRRAAACFARAGRRGDEGRSLLDLGAEAAAVEAFLAVPEDDPDHLEAMALAGLTLLRGGDVERGEATLSHVVEAVAGLGAVAPHAADCLRALAESCERRGDLPRAITWWRRLSGLLPDDDGARLALARLAPHRKPEPEAASAAEPGSPLPERYEPIREIGRGGMARVWLARDRRLDRPVAIKLLSDRWRERPELRERFLREARVSARLSHPNVVTVHDVGEHAGKPCMALEHVDGRDLGSLIRERGRLPPAEAIPILAAVARALHAAHERGIVHRDVKPENILIGADGSVKLGDFGIAWLADAEATESGTAYGTPRYMAPEQVMKGPIDGRTDLYALGGTAFTLLAGRPPFTGGDLLSQQVQVPAPDLGRLVSGLPAGLVRLVAACLAKEPDQRPSTAAAVLAALEAAALEAAALEAVAPEAVAPEAVAPEAVAPKAVGPETVGPRAAAPGPADTTPTDDRSADAEADRCLATR